MVSVAGVATSNATEALLLTRQAFKHFNTWTHHANFFPRDAFFNHRNSEDEEAVQASDEFYWLNRYGQQATSGPRETGSCQEKVRA
jgi:hypothetical protein